VKIWDVHLPLLDMYPICANSKRFAYDRPPELVANDFEKTPVRINLEKLWLVVSNMNFIFHIWDVILPIDELHHFFKMVIPDSSAVFRLSEALTFQW